MQAYAKSLAADGTTMVLNPNSEFFKYFGMQQGSGDRARSTGAMKHELVDGPWSRTRDRGPSLCLGSGAFENMMKAMRNGAGRARLRLGGMIALGFGVLIVWIVKAFFV